MAAGDGGGKPLDPVRLALLELRELKAKLAAAERARSEPIAIVGTGLRFPGDADSPDSFWRLLREGRDGISEVPADRWDAAAFFDPDPDAAGKITTRFGGFLRHVDRFDARFFGVSPREAASIDPQQRLLLEVAWEALEHAAVAPSGLAGRHVGVFVGVSNSDYSRLLFDDATAIDSHFATGSQLSVLAGRLSYLLGLRGPSLIVDTACSSSLVALHLACQSLRAGECELALAGGVNLILLPEITVANSRARMLARDGRCKTFDGSADGYVRSEGCGVVVLKKLSDAQAAGDRILAVIRSTAVNQDGQSAGLTAPSGPAQEELIKQALAQASLDPSAIDYVEVHGTGTELGDPIELKALGGVFASAKSHEHPLLIGSVKTNIGHLESAAGIAGLIKVIVALEHGEIPPHLHLRERNPHVAWQSLPFDIPTSVRPWPRGDRRRIAGVSSFGFSGTNAHVIVEEAPAQVVVEAAARSLQIVTLSAKSGAALREMAAKHADHLAAQPDLALSDLSHTTTVGRSHFQERLAVVSSSTDDVAAALRAFADGSELPARCAHGVGSIERAEPEIAFLFTGQGSQYAGMGRRLYEAEPVFRNAIDTCEEILRGELDRPLRSVMFDESAGRSPIDDTVYTQPAIFALEYALAELWRSWGIRPSIVLGHSLGEDVAAAVAGIFSLEDGLKLVAARGRLMQALPDSGAMFAIMADERRVERAIAPYRDRAAIAALNGPQNVVISGERGAVSAIAAQFERESVRVRDLNASRAFHSPLMDPMLDEFERAVSAIRLSPPEIRLVSNVTGDLAGSLDLARPGYWRRHVRETVRFDAGMRALAAQGVKIFLEVGPRPTLVTLGQQVVADDGVRWLASLGGDPDDLRSVCEALAGLYAAGAGVDWPSYQRGFGGRAVALPTYPFQRQRHWIENSSRRSVPQAVADPIYEVTWPIAASPARNEEAAEAVAIFADRAGVGRALADRLRAAGRTVWTVAAGDRYEQIASNDLRVNPRDRNEVDRAWKQVEDGAGAAGIQVIFLWALDATEEPSGADLFDAVTHTCGGLLHVVQAAASSRTSDLVVVTQDAQAVTSGQRITLAQSGVLGFLKTVARELPGIRCRAIDLDLPAGRDAARVLDNELGLASHGEAVAFRQGIRRVARLAPASPAVARGLTIRPDASYLITGGLGSLGLRIAEWMVDRGARSLVLSGRREPSESAQSTLRSLEARGVRARVVRGDVARPADVDAIFDVISRELPPLAGIVHAAGVRDDGVVEQQTWDRLQPVLAPKVMGAWLLHERTLDKPLDFFVLFSSAAAVIGSPGQSNYAAGNAFLAALAHERRRVGLPATSIAWGAWDGGGMASEVSDADRRRWERSGIGLIQTDSGLKILEKLLGASTTDALVLPADWNRFAAESDAGMSRLFSELVDRPRQDVAPAAPEVQEDFRIPARALRAVAAPDDARDARR